MRRRRRITAKMKAGERAASAARRRSPEACATLKLPAISSFRHWAADMESAFTARRQQCR